MAAKKNQDPKEETPKDAKLFDGIVVPRYRPKKFAFQGDSYVWDKLTRTQIEKLAKNPMCSFINFEEKKPEE